MSSVAQLKTFGPFFDGAELVTSPRIYHYAPGTTTLKNAYIDRAKSDTALQPLIGDSQGIASAYFDGLYKIRVCDANDRQLYVFDNWGESLPSNVIDVTNPVYGAVGDGSTDDLDAINRAIAQVTAKSVLYFPAGHYRLSDNTASIVTNAVKIMGDGKGLTIIERTAFSTSGGGSVVGGNGSTYATSRRGIFSFCGVSGVEVCDLSLVGAGAYNAPNGVSPLAGKALYGVDVADYHVHDCDVSNIENEGIYGEGDCPRTRFERNYCHNIANAALNLNSSNTTSDKCYIVNNIVVDAGDGAVQTTGVSVNVSGNNISSTVPLDADQILIENTQDFVVANNTFQGCDISLAGVALIHVLNQAGTASPNGGSGNITGNTFRKNKQPGATNDVGVVTISHGVNGNISIVGNLFDSNYNAVAQAIAGVWVTGAATTANIHIAGNQFIAGTNGTGTQTIGIGIAASASANKVRIGVNGFAGDVTTPYQFNAAPGGGGVTLGDYLEGYEMATDAAAGPANTGRLYFRDNGGGKTQLVCRFSSGAVQVIATQP